MGMLARCEVVLQSTACTRALPNLKRLQELQITACQRYDDAELGLSILLMNIDRRNERCFGG